MSSALPPVVPAKHSLWDVLDSPSITGALADAGVLDKFKALVDGWRSNLPPGVIPPEVVTDKFFADAMAAFPGVLASAITDVKPAIVQLVLTGKSPITH